MDFSPTALCGRLSDDLRAHFSDYQGSSDGLAGYLNRPEVTPKEFAAGQLLSSIVKKYVDNTKDADRSQRAVAKFLEINEACATYSFDPSRLSLAGEECHELVTRYLRDALEAWDGPRFDWEEVYSKSYFGPGSSYGTTGISEYEKLSGTLGCTKAALYQQWLRDRGVLPLEAKTELVRRFSGGRVRVLDESSLSCVPKNAEIDRTICSEPSLNTFYQLGLGKVLERFLSSDFGIKLEIQQEINRHLARIGSATGRYATIDLSSASDSISRSVVSLLFPEWFSGLLNDLRCSHTRLTTGERVELHMISSMGNGYTFPLQTMIFVAIVRAAYHICGIPYRGWKARHQTFGVNGDDIIVDIRAFNLVSEMLGAYGFTINSSKTFSEGPFRESCGGDYYDGHYVRGVYAKSMASRQDFVSLINRLNVWSGRWGISLKRTVSYLWVTGRLSKAPLVPRWDTDTSGLKLPFELLEPMRKRMGHKPLRVCRQTGSILYERWAARPAVVCVLEPGESPPRHRRSNRLWNEAAIIACSISGTMRNRTYTTRSNVVRYESRVSVAPCWDQYYDTRWQDLSIPAVGRRRWLSAVTENLTEVL